MNVHWLSIGLLCGLGFAPTNAVAGTVVVNPSDLSVITNLEGESRVLFHLPVSALPENARIERATLMVTLAGPAMEKALDLQVHPVTTPWNAATVSWTLGWNTPGGDFDSELYNRFEADLSQGAVTLGIDITHLMKEILEEGFAAYGFIVTVPPYVGEGIEAVDLPWALTLSTSSLDVLYRIYSAPPPWADDVVQVE